MKTAYIKTNIDAFFHCNELHFTLSMKTAYEDNTVSKATLGIIRFSRCRVIKKYSGE